MSAELKNDSRKKRKRKAHHEKEVTKSTKKARLDETPGRSDIVKQEQGANGVPPSTSKHKKPKKHSAGYLSPELEVTEQEQAYEKTPILPKSKKSRENADDDSPTKSKALEEDNIKTDALVSKDSRGFEGYKEISRSGVQNNDDAHWSCSEPAGGRFLDLSTVFSADESHLMVATSGAVEIYDTSNSLLVRRLNMRPSQRVTSFALSIKYAQYLYVSTDSGYIYLFDWTTGGLVFQWTRPRVVHSLEIALEADGDELIFTVEKYLDDPKYEIWVHTPNPVNGSIPESTILSCEGPLVHFSVHNGGEFVVALQENVISIGARDKKGQSLNDVSYTWYRFQSATSITCADVATTNRKGKTARVDVTLGLSSGAIHIYQDLLAKLVNFENSEQSHFETAPRILHWHRRSVGAVRWATDGEYLVSGGQETVLCLWNLSSSKRNDLPHLVSPIRDVIVSPSGSSYAVSLDDNSVIVLQTADLKPTTSIAGVQLPAWTSLGLIQTAKLGAHPAAIDPRHPHQLLTTVPSSQTGFNGELHHIACPYVQRFDLSTNRHVSRQAVTRNNATIVMDSVNGAVIKEPNVVHMQLSCDGEYLATVDEWTPPTEDLSHAAGRMSDGREEQGLRREIYLKFWHLDKATGIWNLMTRIDSPHLRDDGCTAGSVFSLVSDPRTPGFATLGDDGHIKIWAPKTKLDNGSTIRGSARGSTIWSVRHSIELERACSPHQADRDSHSTLQVPTGGSLAYSSDGSVLAATQVLPENLYRGLVHLVSTATGTITFSRAGLYTHELASIQLLNRYLIIFSHSLTVWDIVADELCYTIPQPSWSSCSAQQPAVYMQHLTVNPIDATYAITFCIAPNLNITAHVDKKAKARNVDRMEATLSTRIAVFKVDSPTPLVTFEMPNPITSLLATPKYPGYVLIDAAAEIHVMTPPAVAGLPVYKALDNIVQRQLAVTTEAEDEDVDEDEAMKDTDVVPEKEKPSGEGESEEDEEDSDDEDDNDKPVVRPEQLAEIFDVGPSFAMPPMRQLFKSVVGLYARKPQLQASL